MLTTHSGKRGATLLQQSWSGNPELARIIPYIYLHNQTSAHTNTACNKHANTNIPVSMGLYIYIYFMPQSRLEWKPRACQDHPLHLAINTNTPSKLSNNTHMLTSTFRKACGCTLCSKLSWNGNPKLARNIPFIIL